MYKPVYVHGRLAYVIYDTTGRLTYDDLIVFRNLLLAIKHESLPLPPPQQFISDVLKSGENLFKFDLSEVVNYPLTLSTIFIDQNHLPDGMLSLNQLRILICPEKTQYVTILPYLFWSNDFKSKWLESSKSRFGKSYLIDDMIKKKTDYEKSLSDIKQKPHEPIKNAIQSNPEIYHRNNNLDENFFIDKYILIWILFIIIFIVFVEIAF